MTGVQTCALPISDAPNLLPPADPVAGLVLAVADGTPRNPLSQQRRRRVLTSLRAVRWFFSTTMGLVFAALTAILGVGFVLLAFVVHHSVLTALYLTMLDAAGAAYTGQGVTPTEEVAQFVLTFDGLAFLPLVTAAIVSARLPAAAAVSQPPLGGHVIVAGLGNLGTRIIEQLHDLGIDVLGVEYGAGVALALAAARPELVRRLVLAAVPTGDELPVVTQRRLLVDVAAYGNRPFDAAAETLIRQISAFLSTPS